MPRLTLELLEQSPQSLNPANQRQLLLRGFKIPAIENLGGTNDAYECIDLSDNDLIKLHNFPPLRRLHTLLLVNNRISRIATDCFDPLPGLQSVVLTGNKLEKLVDLEALFKVKTLERLSLLENPCTKVKHYRPYMIFKCSPTLRILDFNRIKDKERKAAALLFAGERGEKLMAEIAPARAITKDEKEKAAELHKTGPSAEAIERIKKAIAEAETIEEVTRLERALKSGVLPDDLKPAASEAPAPGPAPAPEGSVGKAAPPAPPAGLKRDAPDAEMKDAEPTAKAPAIEKKDEKKDEKVAEKKDAEKKDDSDEEMS